jgi:hypothetical protein
MEGLLISTSREAIRKVPEQGLQEKQELLQLKESKNKPHK